MKHFILALILLYPCILKAKDSKLSNKKTITLFTSWGYNRAYFTNSAIHFTGSDYTFTIRHAQARDRQSPFSFDTYFNPGTLSIPQYNFCIGATLPNHISISIGQDHMKYVVQHGTTVTLDGSIQNGTEFSGDYHNESRILTDDFLQFEHTNGLNYVHAQVSKEKEWFNGRFRYLTLKTTAGLHAGVLIPKSDVKLMHYNEHDQFHLAGYGMGFNIGIKAQLFRAMYVSLDNKTGFINMPDILTRGTNYTDRAHQYFGFTEFFYAIGFQYAL